MFRASDFIATIGVNVRAQYTNSDYSSAATMVSALRYLGIDHVRDWGVSSQTTGQRSYDTLATAGIKFDLVLQSNRSPDDFIRQVATFALAHPGAVAAIEGPNEVNLQPPTYNKLTGAAAGQAMVNRMAALAAVNPALAGVAVYDLTGARTSNTSGVANVHLYAHSAEQPSGMIQAAVTTQAQLRPGTPMVITELGYLTGAGRPGWEGVDQPTQAKLTLNALLDAEKAGFSQTYLFQLFDAYPNRLATAIDANMGLFKFGYEPKASAVALHNFTAILADHGGNAGKFALTAFDYSVANQPGGSDTLAVQKSDGTIDVVLWAEPTFWNASLHRSISVATTTTTVSLNGGHYDVRLFDPLLSDQPIASYANATSVSVPVSDHPVVVELTAVGSTKPDLDAASSSYLITLQGDNNANTLTASTTDSLLYGLWGDDVLNGGTGNDRLFGDQGADILTGGPGNDLLDGGRGTDTLTGGPGADTFVIGANFTNNQDRIVDFNAGQGDRLEIVGQNYGLAPGALAAEGISLTGVATTPGRRRPIRVQPGVAPIVVGCRRGGRQRGGALGQLLRLGDASRERLFRHLRRG